MWVLDRGFRYANVVLLTSLVSILPCIQSEYFVNEKYGVARLVLQDMDGFSAFQKAAYKEKVNEYLKERDQEALGASQLIPKDKIPTQPTLNSNIGRLCTSMRYVYIH